MALVIRRVEGHAGLAPWQHKRWDKLVASLERAFDRDYRLLRASRGEVAAAWVRRPEGGVALRV